MQSKQAADKHEQKQEQSFDPEASSTFEELDKDEHHEVTITFGSGSLYGFFAEDDCMIGEGEDAIVIDPLQFGLVVEEDVFSGGF